MNPITATGMTGSAGLARSTSLATSVGLTNSASLNDATRLAALMDSGPSSKATVGDSARNNEPEVRAAFQEVVAGTFYKMMLDSLRSSQSELPYLGGGQTEKIFSAQFDQLISSNLSQSHGDWFSNSLFDVSRAKLGLPTK